MRTNKQLTPEQQEIVKTAHDALHALAMLMMFDDATSDPLFADKPMRLDGYPPFTDDDVTVVADCGRQLWELLRQEGV